MPYPLCIDLADVGQSLREHITRHFISKLVFELSSFASCTVDRGSAVSDRAGDYAANGRGDLENMGYGRRVDQLILRFEYRMLARLPELSQLMIFFLRTGTFFCDRTTAQSLPLIPSDVMLAAVMALKAYSADEFV